MQETPSAIAQSLLADVHLNGDSLWRHLQWRSIEQLEDIREALNQITPTEQQAKRLGLLKEMLDIGVNLRFVQEDVVIRNPACLAEIIKLAATGISRGDFSWMVYDVHKKLQNPLADVAQLVKEIQEKRYEVAKEKLGEISQHYLKQDGGKGQAEKIQAVIAATDKQREQGAQSEYSHGDLADILVQTKAHLENPDPKKLNNFCNQMAKTKKTWNFFEKLMNNILSFFGSSSAKAAKEQRASTREMHQAVKAIAKRQPPKAESLPRAVNSCHHR